MVMTLFIVLAFLIILVSNFVQMYSSKSLARESTTANFKFISSKITEAINSIDIQNKFFLDALSYSFSNLDSIEAILNDKRLYISTVANFLKGNGNLLAAYFAFTDKSFFEVMDLERDEQLRIRFEAQANEKWLVVYVVGDSQSNINILTYDVGLSLIRHRTESNVYDPTSRPWYKNAERSPNVVTRTSPYRYALTDSYGISYAKRFNATTTIASDILVDHFEILLKESVKFKSMNNFLFLENGDLLYSTTSDDNFINNVHDFLLKNNQAEVSQYIHMIGDSKYIINISSVDNLQDEYLVSTVSLDDAMGTYADYFNTSTRLTALLFVIFIPVIWYLASIIVNPVLDLKTQSDKVKDREYSHLKHITSNIREIQLLSNSMLSMAQSIHRHQHELEVKVKERTKELEEKNIELEKLSLTDKLTNICNRIKLDNTLNELITRAQRYDEEFSVMIIDIDYFKQVNDTYGHQVGDTTLIEFASILRTSIRAVDIVGRWGGEEFIVISPHTSLEGMTSLANKLRKKIKEHNFPAIGNKTASFGVTSYRGKKDSVEKIIQRADKALYIAKKNGRDRVEQSAKDIC